MAAKKATFLEEIDDNFLSCIICSERYKNAKLLPCLHSFCEPCLDKLAEEGGTITCPICRRSHQLPGTGVAGIGANLFINELVEIVRKREETFAYARVCEGCEQAESVKHCLECGVDMCNNCAIPHSRLRISRSHHLMTLEEYEVAKSDDPASLQPPVYCTRHSDNQVDLYCDTCEIAICYKCAALDHARPEHSYIYLKDAAHGFSEYLEDMIDRVKAKEVALNEGRAVVTEVVKSLDGCYQADEESMKQHIQKTIDDVTRMIRENGDKLLQELKDEYDKRKVNLNAQLKELECRESDMSYAREYAERLMHYGNAAQLMSAKTGISAQMEELLRVGTKTDPVETDNMEFQPSVDFCKTKTIGVVHTSARKVVNNCPSSQFKGAGSQLLESPSQPRDSTDEDGAAGPSDDIHCKPTVALQKTVNVITGEEGEDELYSARAKLYLFDRATSQWKDHCIGDIKMLKHRKTGKVRILMRKEPVLTVFIFVLIFT
ncbi:E3 ubiquitin-protein ligase TRIM56-like [Ptychodera flava]|uniref:E3 ubiquitin-protein ligase TRIM56-like n=1 Tax=Ptychodera flava TaxID=63121 RepID=UPI00396A9B92